MQSEFHFQNIMTHRFLAALLLLVTLHSFAQDTITVMHYNLLNYGNYTSYCTSANNNHEQKDVYIKTITDYIQPDIFTVNEISEYEFYHNQILSNVLNTGGRTNYRKANITNIASSYIINGLYYNSDKFVLYKQYVAQSYIRDINVYSLYYRHSSLSEGDTTFLHCIVAHLKASSGSSNEQARAAMASATINWLQTNLKPGNFLMMGDFNLYTSEEAAYQHLTNPLPVNAEFRFYDPVDKPGDWNNNSQFAKWHTQSVSSQGTSCQASGGMDDRFDFILASGSVMQGAKKVKYVADSYWAVGQDGKHFNKSITDSPANTTVPSDVLNALANNSDHLPVMLKLQINTGPVGIEDPLAGIGDAIIIYEDGEKFLKLFSPVNQKVTLRLISITGQELYRLNEFIQAGTQQIRLHTQLLPAGVYLVNLVSEKGKNVTLKLVN